MSEALELVLILLASAVLVVVVFRSLHLPPLLGYLIVGVAIGPHALGWVAESPATRQLAEFGVVFLMFTLGLEFSLPRLVQMRGVVLGLGGSQVALAMAVLAPMALVFGMTWQAAVVLAGALAMSSTAIVIRLLVERIETETPHGRQTIGVLLFQDLAVVPLLILIPALAGSGETIGRELGLAALKAAGVLTVVLLVGQRLMRPWFTLVARRRSHELFIINVLFITLGLAYLTQIAGLSLALGAFVAGMLISETQYRHQVEEDIKPFREVLLGLFFISVGMQLDLRVVAGSALLVLAIFAVPPALKFALVAGLSRMRGAPPGTAIRSGLALAQAGEFGLVLIVRALDLQVLDLAVAQVVVAGMLLSMLAAPFLIQHSDRIALRLSGSEWMLRSLQLHQVAVRSLATERHVVICGYGRTGQNLARFLGREGIGYVALDLDPERVREAAAAGDTVVFGDASRRETLIAAGIKRAAVLVVTYTDAPSALRILHHAHEISAALPVIVRTRDDSTLERLEQAGATEVVPDTFETSLMLASHAMLVLGVPVRRVLSQIRTVREQRYRLLRGFYHGATDDAADLDDPNQPRLHSVSLDTGAHAVGHTLAELALTELGAEVTAIRRRGIRAEDPAPEARFEEGDVVVLLGRPDALEAAEARLLQG
ncbi:MAG TPA: monovalent cation:proton antiporter-2 (CPA2) family protein [Burkholderiales bacterium]|nr:monovalent cation:proton antiporter-2 (CPA2) family protein [Burkholderiales bacterium]